nr:MAG: hypothetical protein [Gammatorquevirus sp.]
MSPLTLRRQYLPRTERRPKPLPAHQKPALPAAAAQAQLTNLDLRFKSKTKEFTSSIRLSSLTRFQPGFEADTERELAIAFHRPPRTYKEDTPFYPWLPPAPKICFQLNFKG